MKKILITLAIILLAFFFRFNNLNWDENFHLHPDERFLTMVGTAMKLPSSINQYFDQKTSLMNPTNIGYPFFVYGRFPLILTKYLASVYKMDNYNDFTIFGRQLSSFFDILIIFFIIKTVELLEKKYKLPPSTKYWSGLFYAITVLPIQLSHFFAVDTFLNFFMFGSFYFALNKKNILSAIFFGLALSCKVTALFILPLNLFFLVKTVFVRRQSLTKTITIFFLYFISAYFTLRLADPYLFQNSNLFDPTISKIFVENIKSLQNMTVKNMDNWFPPMVQWLNKNTVLHSLINNIVFGMGIVITVFVLVGLVWIILNIKDQISKIHIKYQRYELLVIFLWVSGFFVYQSIQVTPTLRYFIIVYPFFAIFSGIGINFVLNKFHQNRFILNTLYFILCIFLLIWPLMFSSIYFNKNSRVEASEWIYKNLPNDSHILSEAWDDGLPLPIINNYGKRFSGEQLPVFDSDTPEKWRKINLMLDNADYYILTSNRGWGSIPTVPEKYPLMSKFYNELLENKNPDYKKIKEFTSYPSLRYLGIPIEFPDQWSDEAFTVYDHQKVLIYENIKNGRK